MKTAIATIPKSWKKKPWKKTLIGLLLAIATAVMIIVAQPVIAQAPVSQTLNSQTQGGTILESANRLYAAGQLTEAIAAYQKALKIYQVDQPKAADKLNQALCLSYLALAYQDLGELPQAQTAIAQSSDLLNQQSLSSPSALAIAARVNNAKGSLQLANGKAEAALTSWKLATNQYAQIDDRLGEFGSQINQAQALQTLGLFRQSRQQLEAIELGVQRQPDSLLKALALRSLGNTLQTLGELAPAQKLLEQSLAIAKQLSNPSEISATFLSLGNNYRFLQNRELALQNYQQAAQIAPDFLLRLEAQAVQLSLLAENKQEPETAQLWQQIEPQLESLKPSRRSIYLRVNLADSLIKTNNPVTASAYSTQVANLLAIAIQQAQQIQDFRAESFATGELAMLYAQNKQLADAYQLAQKAMLLAQSVNADDLLYRWQALSGKVLRQQGENERAIAAYSQAVQNIQSLRRDIITTAPEVQFAFRDQIEPIYRELVDLLLRESAQNSQPSQKNLILARNTLEALQVVELENYFRSVCLDLKPQQIDAIDPNSAVIYSAVLSDRLAVIYSFPNAPLRYHATAVSASTVQQTADQYLQSLNPAFSNSDRFKVSQQLYDWLIRPTEPFLTERKTKNLIFVLDSALRNLPMSALHDRKQYAIEKYSIALTPGLQILGAKTLDRQQLKVWLGGLSEARQGFRELAGVKIEADQIAQQIPTNLQLNKDFTKANLENGLTKQDTAIIHLATHGQFSSDPDSTFILAWDKRITVPDFYRFLRDRTDSRSRPLELLILSACKTAEGDNRATLGLSGIALRSGARSTIGSLWAVNDRSTSKLMTNFYDILIGQPSLTRAEVLQKSQLAVLKDTQYQHPYYWAAFVLIGSWL